ncbi:MAG: N-acetyl-gamma-glutamyl-phosphate reductase [Cyclobacteriaceae bacterium]|nr:N-acetyl-gamma-glutamyl-phosphate reductase [Cyclobacteriaceae bacterium]
MHSRKKVAIAGATGYTGSELVRILHQHPGIELIAITSESHAGKKFSEIHPQFLGIVDHRLIKLDDLDINNTDLIFLALPHGVSMEYVKVLKGKNRNLKIIDLSGDFRLGSPELYRQWYKKDHIFPQAIPDAVFGLPELYREAIANATLVANPGCYPTSAILALAPLLGAELIDQGMLLIDAKSGVSGAGVKPGDTTHFANVHDNFKAYGLCFHRHTIEIEEQIGRFSEQSVKVQFTPHLLPVDRGILSTIYFRPRKGVEESDLVNALHIAYDASEFVHIVSVPPSIKNVRGSNFCHIYATIDRRTGNGILISVIDNLVKGASGQAVQNMNLMLNFDEGTGLKQLPLKP